MKKTLPIVIIMFMINLAYCQTANTSLTAKKIDNNLYLDYNSSEFRYGLEDSDINQKIKVSKSFSSTNESVTLWIKSKNPITNDITIESKTIVNDDNKKFQETLDQIIQQLAQQPALVRMVGGMRSINNEQDFMSTIDIIIKLINETNEDNINDKLTSINTHFGTLVNYVESKKNSLNTNDPVQPKWYDDMRSFEAKSELVVSLNSYIEIIKAWNDEIKVNSFKKHYIDNISRDSIQVRNISLITKVLVFDSENKKITIENSSKTPLSTSLKFEKFSRFIPEVRAAVVFTDLSFPKFGTEMNDNDELVVADAGEEDFNRLNVGLMINFNYNVGDSEFVPFFQLGVGPTKKYPILFSGLGIRVSERFMLSGGAAWTWVNELSSLNIGDIISGTAAVENDQKFKFTSDPNFYLSLQVKL